MKAKDIGDKLGGLIKYKYLILVLLVGAILIMLPGGSRGVSDTKSNTDIEIPEFSLSGEETRLEEAIRRISGVGEVKVLLSLKGSVERELAANGDEAIIISGGSGSQNAVARRYIYPEYLGALVICEGGGEAEVKFNVTRAIQAVTGLGSDKITVIKMTNNF